MKTTLRRFSLAAKHNSIMKSNTCYRLLNMQYRLRMLVPRWLYAQLTYHMRKGKFLNLRRPRTFAERLWWMKFHYFNPLMTLCSDKWEARKYVESCGLGHILTKCYGCYASVDDIDLSGIPSDEFFLKVTNTSGGNRLCRKDTFALESIRPLFSALLRDNFYWHGREYNYKYVVPRIMAEEVLRPRDGSGLIDYKFFCTYGEPKLLFIDTGVCNEDGSHAEFSRWFNYDIDFRPLDIMINRKHTPPSDLAKPANYADMVEYARVLSRPFPHCRVDLYNVDGKIYFGEITFFHCSGYTLVEPREADLMMGSWVPMDKSFPRRYSLADVERCAQLINSSR